MPSLLDIPTSAHPDVARDIAYATLVQAGVRLTPTGTHAAVGERGSLWGSAFFGDFTDRATQHVKIQVITFALGDAGAVVRVANLRPGLTVLEPSVAQSRSVVSELQARVAAALPPPVGVHDAR